MNVVPSISVIIPTRNRRPLLQRTLAALERQGCSADAFEVIVVADGCTDDTVTMVQALRPNFALRLIKQAALGVTPARNRGASQARSSLLLHLDDDIEAGPELIAAHLRAHQDHPERVVQAPYILEWRGQPGYHQIWRQFWWNDKFLAMSREGYRFSFQDIGAGNLSLPAALYHRVGGFNPMFVGYGGKDYELGARLIKAGAQFAFAANALGYHRDDSERSIDRALERTRQQARNEVRLGQIHPELRPALPITGLAYRQHGLRHLLFMLAFSAPGAGDRLAAGLRRLLNAHECTGRHAAWRRLADNLRMYWYSRGVAEELGSRAHMVAYVQAGQQAADACAREITLDLGAGIAHCEMQLDHEQPDGVRLHYGTLSLLQIPPVPGAEPLRGVHLRPLLKRPEYAWPLSVALALEQINNGDQTNGI